MYTLFFFFPQKKLKYKVTRVASNSVCFSMCRYIIYPFPKWAHFFFNQYRLQIDRATDQNDARTTVYTCKKQKPFS